MYAKTITIENDCWLASNVVVCAGVTIGEGCVIGAGSVVTRDIPPQFIGSWKSMQGYPTDYRRGFCLFEKGTVLITVSPPATETSSQSDFSLYPYKILHRTARCHYLPAAHTPSARRQKEFRAGFRFHSLL